MKVFASVVILLVTASVFSYFFWYLPKFSQHTKKLPVTERTVINNHALLLRLKNKAALIKEYDRSYIYNRQYCFLIDMKIPSGKKRFFIYNLEKDSVENSGLVTHGSGSGRDNGELYFSNKVSSNCTSLGKYKIGNSYNGKFGFSYKLHGLEKTNNKAFERFVVLHSHECVPDEAVYPFPICESWGCPTVSPVFLTILKEYITNADKPILLWIYY